MHTGSFQPSGCSLLVSLLIGRNPPPIRPYRSKDGIYIEPSKRRYPVSTKLYIHNATSERDAGQYLCRTDRTYAEPGAKFGQIIELRGNNSSHQHW